MITLEELEVRALVENVIDRGDALSIFDDLAAEEHLPQSERLTDGARRLLVRVLLESMVARGESVTLTPSFRKVLLDLLPKVEEWDE